MFFLLADKARPNDLALSSIVFAGRSGLAFSLGILSLHSPFNARKETQVAILRLCGWKTMQDASEPSSGKQLYARTGHNENVLASLW